MTKPLKILHLLGLALFLGSIPGHIVLGEIAGSGAGLAGFSSLLQAKHVMVLALTLPGLLLMLLTGAGLLLTSRGLWRTRWMRVKLGLVVLVALNALLVLTPLGAQIAALAGEAAASGVVPPALAGLALRESLFGALNLVMILTIVALAVTKPRLGGMSRAVLRDA